MNEELKIIIRAVTADAQKNIKAVGKELQGLEKSGGKSGKSFGAIMGKIGGAVALAAGVAVAAIGAITGALTNLSKSTQEYRTQQAKLNSAFLAAGASTAQAEKSYSGLFRFLGDSGKATEAAAHLAKLTTEEKALAEWTTNLQGIYATFGDSLPIEGLTEAANETARVGKVTGTLADALNWAGVSEDAFNASLENCNSTAERETLIRSTLNNLYGDAARIYEENNKEILEQNEAQDRLNKTLAQLGKTTTPLVTALANLSNELLTALAPAITVVTNFLVRLINFITRAVQWVRNLIAALTGSKKGAQATASIASGFDSAAGGAGSLTNNINSATKAAEKLKRTTAGFDELNVMSSGASGSGGAGGGGIDTGGGGFAIDTGLTDSLGATGDKISGFAEKVKSVFEDLKNKAKEWLGLFQPTVDAWAIAFSGLGEPIQSAFSRVMATLGTLQSETLVPLAEYLLGDFVPNIVNSFSINLAPAISDAFGFALDNASKNFETFGGLINDITANIITPALESIKTVATDTFSAFGKAWQQHGKPFLDKLNIAFEGLREDINEFYKDVIEPIVTKAQAAFDKVWKEGLKPLVDNVAESALEIGECLLDLYNEFIKPIVDWIQAKIYPIIVWIVDKVIQNIADMYIQISQIISGLVTVIKGIVQFITGVFTGDWEKAWLGIKNIFKGIFEALVGVIRTPLNRIIDGINALLSGIAKAVNTAIKAINKMSFTIPDWVPGVGGQKFGFNIKEMTAPKIPKLATGGIVDSATLAMIGERGKEAVLPLENNTQWMDKLADKIASRNSTPSKIVLMLDGKELGWANIHSINSITEQTGQLQLVF